MRRMISAARLLLAVLAAATAISPAEDTPYFTLSSQQTFGSNGRPTVSLSGFNIDALRFRVYRINDPVKFFEQLDDSHFLVDFAVARRPSGRPLIEQFHQWKRGLRAEIRRSLRAQFTESPSDHWNSLVSGNTAPTGSARGTEYTDAAVLNPQQLVLTFTQSVQGKERWQQQLVEVPVKEQGLYLVEAVHGALTASTILMVSDTVMITKAGNGKVLNLVVDRNTGLPLQHVSVSAVAKNQNLVQVKTNSDGIAEFAAKGSWADDVRIVARNGPGVAVTTLPGYARKDNPWTGYIYTDRPVYRPGHVVHFRGVLRLRTDGGYQVPAGERVSVQIQASNDQPVYQKTLTVSANGIIHDELELPATAPLGVYSIQVKSGDDSMQAYFEVEEYKKPEYEVHVTPSKTRVLQGEKFQAVIDARYYFGEPVSGAKVHYRVFRSRYWFPYLYDEDDASREFSVGDDNADQGDQIGDQDGQLNDEGKLTITVPTSVSDHKYDYRYFVQAEVTDAGNRGIEATGAVVATYGNFFVKIEPQRYFYEPGSQGVFTVQARDYSNQPVHIPVRLQLLAWNYREPDRSEVKVTRDVDLNADGTATVSMDIPRQSGAYLIRAMARSADGREPEASSSIWVSGGTSEYETGPNPTTQIVSDKKTYRAGDTAKILIVTGRPNTAVYVTVEGRGVRQYKILRSAESTASFEVPTTANDEPGISVNAAFVRDGTFHDGSIYIKVPPVDHQLNVSIATDKPQYLPGQKAEYNIAVTDVAGKPVPNAEFSLGVVDEAIYGIRPDNGEDILKFFFNRDYNRVATENSFNYFFTGQAGKRRMQLAQLRPPSRLAQLKPDRFVMPKIRKLFPDTAFWAADLETDSSGRAHARVEFPDSLTTWRATARGVTPGTKVGSATLKTIVRKNLILRMAAPRFFVQGDEVVLSAIVHNYLSDAKTARVSMDVEGVDVLDGGTKDVQVPSRGEVKVNWKVHVQQIRSVKIAAKALTNEESDGLEMNIPVDVPGVKLTQAHGGSLVPGATTAFDMTFPANAQPGSRSVSIQVAPSVAGSLFGALDYLTSFPYGCVEQTMSSFVPNIVVTGVVQDLGLKANLNDADLQEKIRQGLDRLYSFQHTDRGWGWWQADDSHPFMTAYVVAGLSQARAANVTVQQDAIDGGVEWLRKALASKSENDPDLRAYMLYALALAGKADGASLTQAYNDRSHLSSYGLALLGLALDQVHDSRAKDIAALVEGQAKQDQEQAWWPAQRDPMLDFESDATPESTAYATKLLARQRPESSLLPKSALWLMNHRNEGYWWSSTKQTAMVMYGLADYLRVTKELSPNLTATVYVNDRTVLTRKMDSATGLNPPELVIDEGQLDRGTNHIRVVASGEGRLYYSVRAVHYSAEDQHQKTGSISLNLLRDYYRLVPAREGEKIVYDTVPLNGPASVGDILAVRLTVTGSEWKYMMLEDPIPSGTEFIERDNLYEIKNRPPWWQYFFTRRELHDDRMAIFQTYFPSGQHQYFYLLRVVNPGTFQVSPARVGPMYQTDVSATTETRRLEVH
jgi:alpha-2-macroglobulin